jgi:serine/threonine protein kinase
VLEIHRDHKGLVRSLRMNWLRNGPEPISQLEFARQAAELLSALHDIAGVIHLDLRPDNMVVSSRGVGFVDFGSAVRVGEKISDSALLSGLFEELMRTSEIQRMLYHMTQTGAVTSRAISQGLRRMDKSVDFFFLALQMNCPHRNPDFAGLVRYDPASDEARALVRLTQEILRPADPLVPTFRSARDILEGISQIGQLLAHGRRPTQE